MKKLVIRSIFFLAMGLVFLAGPSKGAYAQANRVSCKQSNKEAMVASRNADKLASQVTKTQDAISSLEKKREASLQSLDSRLSSIATGSVARTAGCFVNSGLGSLFGGGKGSYKQCIERAKATAEAAAKRAAQTAISLQGQKSRVNSMADEKKASLEQKISRLQAELATQQATAAAAKAKYDACVAGGGVA